MHKILFLSLLALMLSTASLARAEEPSKVEQAGSAVKRGAEKTGAVVHKGVETAASAVKRGAKKASEAIERGAEKAGLATHSKGTGKTATGAVKYDGERSDSAAGASSSSR